LAKNWLLRLPMGSPDSEYAVPAVAGLAHEMLQAFDGRLGAFALAVGKAVVDKTLIPPGLNMPAWKLKFVSHGTVTELSIRLEAMGKQASRWQQRFEQKPSAAANLP
jgi:hypothetical protein